MFCLFVSSCVYMLLVGMKVVTVEQMIKENNSQIANLTNYSNQIIVVLINYSFNKCICQLQCY